jgi:DNA-binding MarR family transcriptional regulator
LSDVNDAIRLDWALHALQKQCLARLFFNHSIHFGQPPLLCTIKKLGSCSQNELARTLNVSPASIAVSLKRMEKSGYIQKMHDPNDLRSNRIALTAAGQEAACWSEDVLRDVTRQKFAGFTEEECGQLMHFFARMQQNLIDYKNQLETE